MKRKNKQLCELDLLALKEVAGVEETMSETQAAWMNTAFSPYKEGQRVYPPSYFENAGLIINSQAPFAQRYCACGVPVFGNPGRCQLRKYCPRCAYTEGHRLLKRYQDAFNHGNWHFVTLSFKGNLGLADLASCSCVWDALVHGMNQFLKDQALGGMIVVEELAVREFLPCLLLPHVHVIVQGEAVNAQLLAELGRQIDERLSTLLPDCPLKCDFHVKPIEDQEQFERTLGYVMKPMDLATAYRSAWIAKAEGNSRKAVALNSETRDLILGVSNLFQMRKQIKHFGNLHAQSPEYIGAVEDAKPKRQKKIALSPAQEMAARERDEIALAE